MDLNVKKLMWNPNRMTLSKIKNCSYKSSFQYFRNSSSGYISKKHVREFVFKTHGLNCYLCNGLATQIDHVKSVYSCFKLGLFYECNSLENLKPICPKCNQSKKPEL